MSITRVAPVDVAPRPVPAAVRIGVASTVPVPDWLDAQGADPAVPLKGQQQC